MATIDWTETLSVKIASIDEQHKKLIDLINSFYENINKGSNKERLLEMIKSLKEYTVYHFLTEEKYMKKFNYPDNNNHKIEHAKFIATVLDYEVRYKTGKLILTIEITKLKNGLQTI